jgi:tRNA/tmRNA/rRNA uracil-C5-methylase (TrmA/RlmC/RlmD family)
LLVAGLVGQEGTVVGIDFNSELIETAQARAAAAGIENVSFVVGDAASAPAGSTASSASPLPIAPEDKYRIDSLTVAFRP